MAKSYQSSSITLAPSMNLVHTLQCMVHLISSTLLMLMQTTAIRENARPKDLLHPGKSGQASEAVEKWAVLSRAVMTWSGCYAERELLRTFRSVQHTKMRNVLKCIT